MYPELRPEQIAEIVMRLDEACDGRAASAGLDSVAAG
jgi:hypothetical protein